MRQLRRRIRCAEYFQSQLHTCAEPAWPPKQPIAGPSNPKPRGTPSVVSPPSSPLHCSRHTDATSSQEEDEDLPATIDALEPALRKVSPPSSKTASPSKKGKERARDNSPPLDSPRRSQRAQKAAIGAARAAREKKKQK